MVLGLALAATSAYADTKPAPLGTSVGKLAHKARSAVGSSTASKAKVKAITRAHPPQSKIRIKARTAPVRKAVRRIAPRHSHHAATVVRTAPRRVAPVRTYRAAKVVHRVVHRASRPVTVHRQISGTQRKIATAPAVRPVRKATAPRARPVNGAHVPPTKINNSPRKITGNSLRRAGTDAGLHIASTTKAVAHILPVEVTMAPVRVIVPLIDLPPVTLPRVEVPGVALPPLDVPAVTLPPTVTLPHTHPATLTRPGNQQAVADRPEPARQPAATLGGTTSPVPADETTGTLRGILAAAVPPSSAHATSPPLSLQVWAMTSIGLPAVVLLDDLAKRVRMNLPDSVSPTATALVLAAAIGVAATGTAGSGSAGGSGLAVLAAALRLPALGGSHRLTGRLRVAAFGRPRQPGFSPD